MKAVPFKIPKSSEASFSVQIDELSHFYDRYHHHPEIQITFIEKSSGTLLIGNSISSFNAGDLFIIGANVPHSFRNPERFYKDKDLKAKSISIFFNMDSLGVEFFNLPELKKIKSILMESDKGIQIKGEAKELICSKIKSIQQKKGIHSLLDFLEILVLISSAEDLSYLSSLRFSIESSSQESERLELIFQYILDNYEHKIKLEDIAKEANLSVSAFCRFFKTRTRKTFSKFLNEFRISIACKKLIAGKYSISEICYQVGFTNLSNFNRQFKEVTGFSPTKYIKEITL